MPIIAVMSLLTIAEFLWCSEPEPGFESTCSGESAVNSQVGETLPQLLKIVCLWLDEIHQGCSEAIVCAKCMDCDRASHVQGTKSCC